MSRAMQAAAALAVFASAILSAQPQMRFDVTVQARRLSFDELERIVPALRNLPLPPAVRQARFVAEGPLTQLTLTFDADSADGAFSGRLVLDVRDPERTARGTIRLRDLALARLLDQPALPGRITADATIDLRFVTNGRTTMHGTFDLTTPGATLAGYSVRSIQAKGRIDGNQITLDSARGIAYGANVTARGQIVVGSDYAFDLRGSASDVRLASLPRALGLPRVPSDLAFDYEITGSRAGVRGRAVLAPSQVAGAQLASGTAVTFDTHGPGLDYHATGRISALDPQRAGTLFDIEVLQRERFAGSLNGRFDLTAENGTLRSLEFEAREAQLFGGTLERLTATLTPAEREFRVTAAGRFRNLDPGVILERTGVDGHLSGTLNVTGAIPRRGGAPVFSAADLRGAIELEGSVLEGIPVDRAAIAATLTNGVRLDIARAEFRAGGTTAQVSGVYGLDPSVPTSVTYAIDTANAEALADLLGEPIAGQLALRGTVTGHGILHVAGTMTGTDVAFRGVEAQSLAAKYGADVRRTDPSATTVGAHAEASGLELRGETFKTAAADLVWLPLQDEVRLTALALDTRAGEWRLAEGTNAVFWYGGDRLRVENLRLTATGGQSIAVSGTMGDETAPLRIEARNLDLSPLAPIVRQAHLHGRVDLDAIVGGDRIAFDARLVRPDGAWLEAEGSVPSALLTAGEEARRTAELDVTVRSSAIDLAVIQAFTNAVADVTGTLQVDAAVEGTIERPRMQGQIVVQNGAFSVPLLGTRYTRLTTTILLQPDFVIVENARLFDDDGDWLSVSGRLPVAELARGNVALDVTAQSFEVVDNAYADLEMDALLRVTGRLTRPELVGSVELIGGRINVDEVLTLTGTGVYATRAARDLPGPAEAAAPAREGFLEHLPVELDLDVLAPALLLAGTDVQGPGDIPVGLGDINVTASGDVRLLKAREGPLRVRGEIETVRGTYEFQGREFELVRGGTIRFAGTEEINPVIDVTARRRIEAVETQVDLTGTLDRPRLELSSRPPLDDAEILSLIVFNQSTLQLAAGQRVSLARRAAAFATGLLASEISGALGDALGLDVFEIEAGGLTEGHLVPVLTVGERLGDFYVRFRQQFGTDPRSQVVLEYEVSDWLRIESSVVDREDPVRPLLRRIEGSGIDAVISYDYGGPGDDDDDTDDDENGDKAASATMKSAISRLLWFIGGPHRTVRRPNQ